MAFHRVDTSKLVKGAARIMYADIEQTKPTKIEDVIDLTVGANLYDAQTGWNDLGATREGIQISVNNTEDAFDVDQVQGDIGTAPNSWECFVTTNLAEVTLEHLQIAWEGADITTDTDLTPNEKETGFAGASAYTERRLAVLFQKPEAQDSCIVGYFFHKVVRTPQETTLNFQKTGDAQTIAVRFKALADATVTDSLKQFFIIREQQPTA